jgi:hypothetical protein
MKKLLGIFLLVAFGGSAQAATCVTHFPILDGGSTTQQMAMADDGSGNGYCEPKINIPGLQAPGPLASSASTSIVTATDEGWTPIVLTSITNTAQAVSSSAGRLGVVHCFNPNANVTYLQVYNVASGSVTVGTTVPAWVVPISSSTTDGMTLAHSAGIKLGGSAISVAATTTPTGGTAPSSSLGVCSIGYG